MNTETPPNAAQHVDEVTGLLYVEGQLEPSAARGVVAHLGQCAECRRLLDTLKRESLLLREALTEEDEPLPASLLAPRATEGLSWWWLSMLSLAAAGVYTLWTYYLAPWFDNFQQSGFDSQFFFTWLLLNGASWKGWNEMLQWVILGSLGVLASVVLFVFRRNLRRLTSLSIFLAALLLLMLALPPGTQAAEFVKQHTNYEVPEGQTIHHDLFVMAPSVRMAGTIEGDFFCFCHDLTVEGHVTGDVFAFAENVRIKGKVDGSVRSFTESLTVDGDVGRNVTSMAGEFQANSRSHINGSAMLFAGLLQLDGPLGGDLTAQVGEASLNSSIGGDVRLRQERSERSRHWAAGPQGPVQVGSRADIRGSFRVHGLVRPDISPDAHLASAMQFEQIEYLPAYRNPKDYWYNAMIWGSAFLVGLVLISLVPGFMQETSQQVSRIGPSLGLGLAGFILLPVAGILACATVVGLGLGIPILFLWLFLIFFAQAFAAIWLGGAILGQGPGAWALTGRLALGLLLIRLGALVPVAGFWVRFVACLLGTGGLVLFVIQRLQSRSPQLPPAPQPAAPSAA